ncbi:uncharacterized protein LOC125616561 [Marmota marmota marmota]|uniref:uncharacterized protein LOC125616561 n=1 Tax=Marmota marmota marmota TaxID=9994 RepID=UPI00209211FE|nr:uncharacterized protein LOC125616561 [Marmota marmota marmota]
MSRLPSGSSLSLHHPAVQTRPSQVPRELFRGAPVRTEAAGALTAVAQLPERTPSTAREQLRPEDLGNGHLPNQPENQDPSGQTWTQLRNTSVKALCSRARQSHSLGNRSPLGSSLLTNSNTFFSCSQNCVLAVALVRGQNPTFQEHQTCAQKCGGEAAFTPGGQRAAGELASKRASGAAAASTPTPLALVGGLGGEIYPTVWF